MNRYTKIINMMESYFTKDFEKTKKGFTAQMYKLNTSTQNYRIAFYFLVWTTRSKKIHVNGDSSHLRGNSLIL